MARGANAEKDANYLTITRSVGIRLAFPRLTFGTAKFPPVETYFFSTLGSELLCMAAMPTSAFRAATFCQWGFPFITKPFNDLTGEEVPHG
jgi:hypothetical protein